MEEGQMLEILEHYHRKVNEDKGKYKVSGLPDGKTVFIEKIDGAGRAIVMSEYQVDGNTYWAGYSLDSQTIYVSLAVQR